MTLTKKIDLSDFVRGLESLFGEQSTSFQYASERQPDIFDNTAKYLESIFDPNITYFNNPGIPDWSRILKCRVEEGFTAVRERCQILLQSYRNELLKSNATCGITNEQIAELEIIAKAYSDAKLFYGAQN